MRDNLDLNIATADTLTLLLHNQHAIGAAIDEIANWLSENGAERVAVNGDENLHKNAQALTDVITCLRGKGCKPALHHG